MTRAEVTGRRWLQPPTRTGFHLVIAGKVWQGRRAMLDGVDATVDATLQDVGTPARAPSEPQETGARSTRRTTVAVRPQDSAAWCRGGMQS